MKPKKMDKKLILGKTSIADLGNSEKQHVKGGYLPTDCLATCYTWCGECSTRDQVCGYTPEFTRKISCL